ncbi:hypothetical protein BJF81_13965 [Ornithinimicrobium sp. CNJ-824]|uniref:winged helix family transcriptional regulator n=1 Tax=Ornithinimicrobium sp. CNJ-824 TaxID=1904966 RepID=UPI0009598A62|nr:response regulator transcription factor [Ornithinimicrobium sp. CNJ-824]OLT21951.1 hypothetical protein BJF81_13965 [Ornithinimicrobium sp. CNJ-824]
MSRRVWLIPVQPSPAHLGVTTGVLKKHGVAWSTVRAHQLREALEHALPGVALVHGGVITPLLMDVQRWLTDADVPTLLLVERLTDDFEAVLLDRGARDVIALPAPPRKIGARVEALLRSAQPASVETRVPPDVVVGEIVRVTPGSRTVTVGTAEVNLTRTEFDLLLALALRQPDVLTRAELAEALDRPRTGLRTLDTHISRIRTKLRRAGAPDLLESVREVGYRLRDAEHHHAS